MTFGKFSLRLAAFSGVVAVLLQLVFTYTRFVLPDLWWVFVFFVVMTLVIYYISSYSLKMSVKNSMSLILGSMVFRLFASIIYLVSYLVITGSKDIPFVTGFMALYILFQVFEIYHLLANLRHDLKK